jgi:hypothetical protein
LELKMKSTWTQLYSSTWVTACFVFSYAGTRTICISNTDNIDGSPHVVSKHSKPDFALPTADLFFSARRKPPSLRFSESPPPQGANSYGLTSWSKKWYMWAYAWVSPGLPQLHGFSE